MFYNYGTSIFFSKQKGSKRPLFSERVGGIEPPSSAWKADIKTIIRYPRIIIIIEILNPVNQPTRLFGIFYKK